MSIALLLGSFNPIHNGHLAVARYVVAGGLADKVWFVVSPQNPFKAMEDLAPFDARVAMARLAIDREPRFEVCDIEGALPLPSYTINTVMALRERYPEVQFTILCGSDVATQLDRWYRIDTLRAITKFVVYPRLCGESSEETADAPQYDIAATELRQMVRSGELDKAPIPRPVADYIRQHKLYLQP